MVMKCTVCQLPFSLFVYAYYLSKSNRYFNFPSSYVSFPSRNKGRKGKGEVIWTRVSADYNLEIVSLRATKASSPHKNNNRKEKHKNACCLAQYMLRWIILRSFFLSLYPPTSNHLKNELSCRLNVYSPRLFGFYILRLAFVYLKQLNL